MSDSPSASRSRLELTRAGWPVLVALEPTKSGSVRRLEWNGRSLAWSLTPPETSDNEPVPVIQEARLEHMGKDCPVLLGLGVSARRHYSLSIEARLDSTDGHAAVFECDLAARGASGPLADTWVCGLNPTDLIETGSSRIAWRLAEGAEVVLEVEETDDPKATLAIGEAGRTGWLIQVTRFGEVASVGTRPVTTRLRYRWRVILSQARSWKVFHPNPMRDRICFGNSDSTRS